MVRKLIFVICSCAILIPALGFSQATFYNGHFGMELNEYGRVRVYSDDMTTRQIDRSSMLFATGNDAVFDYLQDADNVSEPGTVETPEIGDFELTVSIDNSWSGLAPNVQVDINVYGWSDGAYSLAKFMVANNEAEAVDAIFGVEFLPQINGGYGFESVHYLPDENVIMTTRDDNSYVGYQIMSGPLTSANFFAWVEGYEDDNDYYTMLTGGEFDELFQSVDADGAVAVFGQESVNMPIGASQEFMFAVAFGATQEEMLDDMALAETAYETHFGVSVEDKNEIAGLRYRLEQNYPNPYNPNTTISFQLPGYENISLKVYNIAGQVVSTVIDEIMEPGIHSVNFKADNLASGVYYYTLKAGSFSQTKMMTLLK